MLNEELLRDEPSELVERLKKLCRENGRYLDVRSNGEIVTADNFDGCDAHYAKNIREAIEWEEGYVQPRPAPVQEM